MINIFGKVFFDVCSINVSARVHHNPLLARTEQVVIGSVSGNLGQRLEIFRQRFDGGKLVNIGDVSFDALAVRRFLLSLGLDSLAEIRNETLDQRSDP